jgi:hypothetical protein
MQIKAADDIQPKVRTLEALLSRPDVDARTRDGIEQEIQNVRRGASGEGDAAYAIEFEYGKNQNRITIHGLRIEVDGRVAQIDHLIINRLLDIWVCESKNFAGGVAINEHGEWVAIYGRNRYGIPSPVEQNRRHIAVLADVFAKGIVPLPRRLGITINPQLSSLVLVSNRAQIIRPKARAAAQVDGLDSVIKVDQLRAKVEKAFDKRSVAAYAKLVSQETLETFARQLAALHVPAYFAWAAKFGLPPVAPKPPVPQLDPARASRPGTRRASGKRPVCAECGRVLSNAVIAFCQTNPGRFGGATYCMDCQKQVGSVRR